MEENSTYQDDWKKEAPKLAGLKKEFTDPSGEVPEGYFEGLEDRIMARIGAEENPAQTKRLGWWKPIAAAAAVAGIGLAVFFATRGPKAPEEMSAEMALVRGLDGVSNEEIAQALIEEDVTMEEVAAAMHEDVLAQVTMEDVAPEADSIMAQDLLAVADLGVASIGVLESSVMTEWDLEDSDINFDDIDLSAFGLEEADLDVNTDKNKNSPEEADTIN